MERKPLIFLFVASSVVLLGLPFILTDKTNATISISFSLISGFSSLLTLIIAVLLFNKFGIETSLLERQTKSVFQLLEDLNINTISIKGNRQWMRFTPAKPYHTIYEKNYDKDILISMSYAEGLEEIWKHCDNVFLPKEIADKLRNTKIFILANKVDTLNEKQLEILAQSKDSEKASFSTINSQTMSLLDFVTKWTEVIDEIKSWISNNSSMKSELNLD